MSVVASNESFRDTQPEPAQQVGGCHRSRHPTPRIAPLTTVSWGDSYEVKVDTPNSSLGIRLFEVSVDPGFLQGPVFLNEVRMNLTIPGLFRQIGVAVQEEYGDRWIVV